jgi:two-component system, OmpR family, sensor histidine kinase BaeS
MNTGITAKLFVAVLATNLLTAIAVGVAVRSSFSAGFRNYVEEREARRIDNLDRALVRAFSENGSWEFLRGDASLWALLNRPDADFDNTRGMPEPPPEGWMAGEPPPSLDGRNTQPPLDNRRNSPPLFEGRGNATTLPAQGGHRDAQAKDDAAPARDLSQGSPGTETMIDRPMHSAGLPRFDGRRRPGEPPPGLLLDRERKVVAGRLDPGAPFTERPVVVAGKTVGFLRASGGPASFDTLDVRFRDEQLRAVWLIGVAAMLIATCVAVVLAKRFLAPIKRLGAATHRLASGDYATRVAPASGDELGRLLDDFNQLAQTLESNERLRRNFMADVSHELRTPLAVLRGELEALQDGLRRPGSDTIASLQAEVATLSKLVDDLYELALADVGALAYRFVRTDIAALLDTAVATFEHRFSARNLGIEYSAARAPVVLDADPQRLTQLFNNLLENCVRHTDPGGHVSIALARDGDAARIDIQDSAPAVPEAAMERIFDRLFRVDASRNRERGGAGLGLAICRNIVEAHRGDIRASPSALGGLWIHIRLPLARHV